MQLSTDVDGRFIVGADVSTLGNDFMLLTPALDDIERRTGDLPRAILVDGGYVHIDAFTGADARDVTVHAPVPKPRTEDLDRFLVRGRSKILCLTLWAAIAYNLLRAPLDALLA